MEMTLQPHLLFVLDDYSPLKGGISSIQHGIIKLMQHTTIRQYSSIKISCITTINTPSDNVELYDGVEVITAGSSLANLVHLDREIFPDKILQEKFSDVTCIVLFAYDSLLPVGDQSDMPVPGVNRGTLLCALPEGLVGQVKKYSDGAKLILINLLDLSDASIATSLSEVDFVFNVGYKVHRENDTQVKVNGKGSDKLLPIFPDLMPLNHFHQENNGNFLVITYASKKTLKDPHFLHRCQQCMGTLKEEFRRCGKANKIIKWEVYYGKGCNIDKMQEADVQEPFSNKNRDRLKVASICIVHGDFEADVYSGLELLLSGVPTISMEGTDTHCTLAEIAAAAASYFCPTTDSVWEDAVKKLLENPALCKKEANDFSEKYKQNTMVRGSLERLLLITCDIDVSLEEIPSDLESDDVIIPSPTPDRIPIHISAMYNTNRAPARSEETIPKVPCGEIIMNGMGNIETDGVILNPNSIVLTLVDSGQHRKLFNQNDRFIRNHYTNSQCMDKGQVVCDGPDVPTVSNSTASYSEGGDSGNIKGSNNMGASSLRNRKEMNSQGDSDGKSSDESGDDADAASSLPSTSKVSSKPRSSSSKTSNSLFTTRKYPKSDFEKQMRKIRKEAEKPVKSKKKSKEKK